MVNMEAGSKVQGNRVGLSKVQGRSGCNKYNVVYLARQIQMLQALVFATIGKTSRDSKKPLIEGKENTCNFSPKKETTRYQRKRPVICFFCGRPNHMRSQCWALRHSKQEVNNRDSGNWHQKIKVDNRTKNDVGRQVINMHKYNKIENRKESCQTVSIPSKKDAHLQTEEVSAEVLQSENRTVVKICSQTDIQASQEEWQNQRSISEEKNHQLQEIINQKNSLLAQKETLLREKDELVQSLQAERDIDQKDKEALQEKYETQIRQIQEDKDDRSDKYKRISEQHKLEAEKSSMLKQQLQQLQAVITENDVQLKQKQDQVDQKQSLIDRLQERVKNYEQDVENLKTKYEVEVKTLCEDLGIISEQREATKQTIIAVCNDCDQLHQELKRLQGIIESKKENICNLKIKYKELTNSKQKKMHVIAVQTDERLESQEVHTGKEAQKLQQDKLVQVLHEKIEGCLQDKEALQVKYETQLKQMQEDLKQDLATVTQECDLYANELNRVKKERDEMNIINKEMKEQLDLKERSIEKMQEQLGDKEQTTQALVKRHEQDMKELDQEVKALTFDKIKIERLYSEANGQVYELNQDKKELEMMVKQQQAQIKEGNQKITTLNMELKDKGQQYQKLGNSREGKERDDIILENERLENLRKQFYLMKMTCYLTFLKYTDKIF